MSSRENGWGPNANHSIILGSAWQLGPVQTEWCLALHLYINFAYKFCIPGPLMQKDYCFMPYIYHLYCMVLPRQKLQITFCLIQANIICYSGLNKSLEICLNPELCVACFFTPVVKFFIYLIILKWAKQHLTGLFLYGLFRIYMKTGLRQIFTWLSQSYYLPAFNQVSMKN